jgi:hypothetical protein
MNFVRGFIQIEIFKGDTLTYGRPGLKETEGRKCSGRRTCTCRQRAWKKFEKIKEILLSGISLSLLPIGKSNRATQRAAHAGKSSIYQW